MRRLSLVTILALASCDALTISQADYDEMQLEACINSLLDYCRDEDYDGHGQPSQQETVYEKLGLPAETADSDSKLLSICQSLTKELQRDLDTVGASFCFQDPSTGSAGGVTECPDLATAGIWRFYNGVCGDCNDDDAAVHQPTDECDSPGDGLDNDCNGNVDEGQTAGPWYPDNDGDGYGNEAGDPVEELRCGEQTGWSDVGGDCNDEEKKINPDADEGRCGDGIDQNCDGDPGDCALYQSVDISDPEGKINGLSFVGATSAVAWRGIGQDDSAYLAVGYPGSDKVNGKVEIYRGGDTGPTLIATLTGDKSSGFGSALAAGDFNNDGVMDLAVAAPSVDQGRVITYFSLTDDETVEFNARAEVTTEVLVGSVLASFGDGTGLAVGYTDTYKGVKRIVAFVQSFENDSVTADADTELGTFLTVDDSNGVAIWPLALASATFGKDTYVGVGASAGGVGLTGPGLAVYKLNETTASLTLADAAISTSALGASVAFGTLSDGTSLVLVGAPGTVSSSGNSGAGAVHMLSDLPSQIDSDPTVEIGSPFWYSSKSNDQVGSAVALIGDVDRDGVGDSLEGDEELAIGGNGVLWIIAQQDSTFPGGDLDKVASGKITGFEGIIRHIVNAGDVDGDTYSDLLISTDSTTYLLYGGYKPAQEDASDTGN